MNKHFRFLIAIFITMATALGVSFTVFKNNDSLSFKEGAEFGTGQVLSIDKTGNLSTGGIISVDDLYISGTAFVNSLNLSEGLYVFGNEIVDSTGRIPGLTIDQFTNLSGSALTGINADKLDGIDSSGFVLAGASIDADKLDGVDSGAFLRSDSSDTAHGALNITAVPGSANVAGGSLYLNPGSSDAGYTLFGISVNDSEKFRIDAEGDVSIAGDLSVTGTFSGTTLNPSFSTGSVVFQGSSALVEDNSNFFWDDTNNRLGIGTTSPDSRLHIKGSTSDSTASALSVASAGGTNRFYIRNDGVSLIGTGWLSTYANYGGDLTITADDGIVELVFLETGGPQAATISLNENTNEFKIDSCCGNELKMDGVTSPFFDFDTPDKTSALSIATGGSVGIGTSTPASGMSLDVEGLVQINLGGTQTSVALCGSHSGGSGATVSDVEIVDCTGTPAADYMEMYPVESGIEKGNIVVVGSKDVTTNDGETITQLVKSGEEYQGSVIGVVSDLKNAGDFNSIGHNIDAADNPLPIALAGRVVVEVSSYSQEISPGDFITTSSESGKAMKAINSGHVIGKAIESWAADSGKSTVMIFVNNSYYLGNDFVIDPETQVLTITRPLNVAKDFIAKGVAVFENVVRFLSDVTFGGTVFFENRVTFADKDLAGYAKIQSGASEVRVEFEKEYEFAPIVQLTPQGKYGVEYWVSDVSKEGFTVNIDPIHAEEVEFSWLAIAVKDAKTHENNQLLPFVFPRLNF